MKNEQVITHLSEVVDEVLFDTTPARYSYENDQPKHFSWIHFYWSYGGLAGEYTHGLEYSNAKEFQRQLTRVIKKVFSPENLEFIREAKLTEFGMHLGPYQPSGGNINDELGIEVIPAMKDRGQ